MEEKGQTCEDAQNTIQNNCNGADNWIKKKLCRYTCIINGLGYEDEEPCCADSLRRRTGCYRRANRRRYYCRDRLGDGGSDN